MSYDITFCSNKECIHTECRRHLNNAPKDRPVSIAVFSEDSKFCEYREE